MDGMAESPGGVNCRAPYGANNNLYSQSMLFSTRRLSVMRGESLIWDMKIYERENPSNQTRVTSDSWLQWGRVTLHIIASKILLLPPPPHQRELLRARLSIHPLDVLYAMFLLSGVVSNNEDIGNNMVGIAHIKFLWWLTNNLGSHILDGNQVGRGRARGAKEVTTWYLFPFIG